MATKSVLEIGYRDLEVTGKREQNFRISLPISNKDCSKCVEVANQGIQEMSELVAAAQYKASRESLLNKIGQAVRCMVGTRTIKMIAASSLGDFLKADRCYFVSYDLKSSKMFVEHDWKRDDLESIAGEYVIDKLSACVEPLKLGTAVIDNLGSYNGAVPPFPESVKPVSIIHIPYSEFGEIIAALVVVIESGVADTHNDTKRYERWLADDISLAETVAAQARSAIDSDRLRTREHNLRSYFRNAVLPDLPDQLPGIDISVYYRPAGSETGIGSSFYDVFTVSDNVTALIVGDINQVEAVIASKVSALRNMLRYALYGQNSLDVTIRDLNQVVVNSNIVDHEAALFVGLYNRLEKSLNYICCGDDPVLLKKHSSDRVSVLISTAPPLGASTAESFHSRTIPIEDGDTLLIYKNRSGSEYSGNSQLSSVSRLIQILRHCRTPYNAQTVLETTLAGVEGSDYDDVCIMTAVITP